MEFQLFHTTLSASLLLFIMAGGFLAGFVDFVPGGGGFISLPVPFGSRPAAAPGHWD